MNKFRVARSKALKQFREKLGSPVRNLNSVIVGLCAVGNGTAKKPTDLAVSWGPKDLKRAETEARGFSIRALMIMACDALDHYLEDLGTAPSPVQTEQVRSILRRETQFSKAHQPFTEASVKKLWTSAQEEIGDSEKLRRIFRDFSEFHFGKPNKPSIRARHSALYDHCKSFPTIANQPLLPRKSYFAAIEILIAWRNVLVHDPDSDQLGSDAISVLESDASFLAANHAGININQTILRYQDRLEPTLKDISTLVSILLRYVAGIDAFLIAQCDAGTYFQEAVRHEIQAFGKPIEILRLWSRKALNERIVRARTLVSHHGFVPDSFSVKRGAYVGRELHNADFTFLEPHKLTELAASIGVSLKKP